MDAELEKLVNEYKELKKLSSCRLSPAFQIKLDNKLTKKFNQIVSEVGLTIARELTQK